MRVSPEKERTCDGSHTYMSTRPSKTALELSNVDSKSVKNPVYVCTSSSSSIIIPPTDAKVSLTTSQSLLPA